MSTKRKIEVFSAGCPACDDTVQLVHDIVWWSAKPATSMKGEGPNAERGAAVLSFSVEGRQQAVMTRALR